DATVTGVQTCALPIFRREFVDQSGDERVDLPQPRGKIVAAILRQSWQRAEAEHPAVAAVGFHHAVARRSRGSRIDPENAHRFPWHVALSQMRGSAVLTGCKRHRELILDSVSRA